MAMKEYKFVLSLCGGYAGGTITVKAQNEELAYDKAMRYVEKKLSSAFPTLEIDYNVEQYFPDTYVPYKVKGNYTVYIDGKDKSISKIKDESLEIIWNIDFGELFDIDWNIIGNPILNKKLDKYEVHFEVVGYYNAYIYDNVDNKEQLEKLGEDIIIHANFGKLKDVKWELDYNNY